RGHGVPAPPPGEIGVPRPDRDPPAVAETARQFGAHARQYAVSRAHQAGATRLVLLERMEPVTDEWLLDIGSGPGPVATAFSPYVAGAIAFDAPPQMPAPARPPRPPPRRRHPPPRRPPAPPPPP